MKRVFLIISALVVLLIFTGASFGEDCISFDPSRAKVEEIDGRYKVTVDGMWLLDFDNIKADADKALNIIQFYGLNSQCFVGRPNASS